MSARKIVDKQRHDGRQRRGDAAIGQSLQPVGDDDLIDVIGKEPSPDMALVMEESFERLIAHLGEGTLREIALAKLEGFSNAEIADRFDCSERTIERRLHLIREKCRQELLAECPSWGTDRRAKMD